MYLTVLYRFQDFTFLEGSPNHHQSVDYLSEYRVFQPPPGSPIQPPIIFIVIRSTFPAQSGIGYGLDILGIEGRFSSGLRDISLLHINQIPV
jgi:hypothetical protein